MARCMPRGVEDTPDLGTRSGEHDFVVIIEEPRDGYVHPRGGELVCPNGKAELPREESCTTDRIRVMMRREDRDDPPPTRADGAGPREPFTPFVVVRRCWLDKDHVATSEGVAVGVRGRRERRCPRREEAEACSQLSRTN